MPKALHKNINEGDLFQLVVRCNEHKLPCRQCKTNNKKLEDNKKNKVQDVNTEDT